MNDHWRWADPGGQQRRVRTDELRAALSAGLIAPNTPVWRSGWTEWQPAHDVPELTSSALSAANGVVQNIPPPPLAMLAAQREYESCIRSALVVARRRRATAATALRAHGREASAGDPVLFAARGTSRTNVCAARVEESGANVCAARRAHSACAVGTLIRAHVANRDADRE